uniref:Ribosome-recycling factor, mitochondrial n=1 Tax=Leptobrachium leishanense TaxID=445787 RepID=A0A8C5MRW8_9ANUR
MALRCLLGLRPVLVPTLGRKAELDVMKHSPQIALSRHLATKKSKAKSKAHSQIRVNINSTLVEDIIDLENVKQEMKKVLDGLKDDFNKNLSIRTSSGSFDHITVTTKDGKFPLNQLGQISLKSPQLFIINMASFPECATAAVNALRDSHMNLNPELDGTIIRVPVPQTRRPLVVGACRHMATLPNCKSGLADTATAHSFETGTDVIRDEMAEPGNPVSNHWHAGKTRRPLE